jgi:hypothetical protein
MPSISIFIGSVEEIVEVIARSPRPVRVQHETIAQGAGQPRNLPDERRDRRGRDGRSGSIWPTALGQVASPTRYLAGRQPEAYVGVC